MVVCVLLWYMYNVMQFTFTDIYIGVSWKLPNGECYIACYRRPLYSLLYLSIVTKCTVYFWLHLSRPHCIYYTNAALRMRSTLSRGFQKSDNQFVGSFPHTVSDNIRTITKSKASLNTQLEAVSSFTSDNFSTPVNVRFWVKVVVLR